MRTPKSALVISVAALLLPLAGCANEIPGAARPDPTPVPLALSDDGVGIVTGFDDAPARIEIFTEPQCTHCRDLQHDFGEQIAYYITVGDLQVTYRPLTFLDDDDEGYSATVANALFLAATPDPADGAQFQRFVEELWSNQDPGGTPFSTDELRQMAVAAGMPDAVADTVATDRAAVDIADMNDLNFEFLLEIDPVQTGTPTVYDLESDEKVDIFDDDWLDRLIQS